EGRVGALALHWRPLVRKAIGERTLVPLDAMFDIARPTHAILFVWSLLYLTAAVLSRVAGAGPRFVLPLACAIVAAQVIYFLAGFAIDRPPLRTWLALAAVPWYLAWKSAVTMRALFTLRERAWVRTTRN